MKRGKKTKMKKVQFKSKTASLSLTIVFISFIKGVSAM